MSRIFNTDGFLNVLSGLGGRNDKKQASEFSPEALLDKELLSSLYMSEGTFTSIVDIAAEDMVKNWITLKNDEDNVVKDILDDNLIEVGFTEALKRARLFGGSLMLLYWEDGSGLENPVNWKKAKLNGYKILNIHDIDFYNSEIEDDPDSRYFGQIKIYQINFKKIDNSRVPIRIHRDRILEFKGEQRPDINRQLETVYRYFGVSVIQQVYKRVTSMETSFDGLDTIIQEFSVSVFTFDNLREMLTAKGAKAQKVYNRMTMINASKSLVNAVLLGQGESFDRKGINVGGLSDIIDRLMMAVSAVSRYPITKLFGRSPAGMNATGEGDENNYISMLEGKQKSQLLTPLRKLVNNINNDILKRPENIKIDFNSLKVLSQKEKSEIDKNKSETQKNNMTTLQLVSDLSVLTPEEIETVAKKIMGMEVEI